MAYVVRFAQLCLPGLLLATVMVTAACASSAGEGQLLSPSPTGPSAPTASGPTPVPGPGVTAGQITIGMTNDMAGSGDTPYAAVTLAMQAYFRKVNAENSGVCGRTVALTAEDDGYSPSSALDKTKKLVKQTGVLAMVGAISTDEQLVTGPYLNDPNADGNTADGVPDLFVSSGARALGDAVRFPWTIDYAPDYVTDGAVLGRYASANLVGKKLAILYPDSDFGKDYLAGFVAGLADRTQLVSTEAYAAGAVNVNDRINLMKSANADAVLLATPPEMTASAISYAASIQYAPQWLLTYTNAPSILARSSKASGEAV